MTLRDSLHSAGTFPMLEADPKSPAEGQTGALDPSETFALHRDNSHNASFGPYQNARLSRYNAVPKLGGRSGHEAAGISRCCWIAAAARTRAARAQADRMRVVGVLMSLGEESITWRGREKM